jgi:hypothetical protein
MSELQAQIEELFTPQADLHFASLGMFEDYRNGYCTLRVTVENMGSAPIGIGAYGNASAVVRAVSGTQSIGDLTLAALDPGGILRRQPPQSVTVTWRPGTRYTYLGTRSFTLQVDPNRVISDASRTNNLTQGSFTCTVAPVTAPRSP